MNSPDPAFTTTAGDGIPARQNGEEALRLLRARQRIYAEARRFQILQILVAVFLPVVGAIAGLLSPEVRPFVAFLSLLIAVFDVAWLDRSQRVRIKLAAKLSEQFDCHVLHIPWNGAAAGKPPGAEIIHAAARAWRGQEEEIRNWYPPALGVALPHIARLACQRVNAWYDGSLRRRYVNGLLFLIVGAFILLLLIGAVAGLPLLDLAATVASPAAPPIIWALREYFRQRDVTDVSSITQSDVEAVMEKAIKGDLDEAECSTRSREFQNVIYARRASSPLMFPLVYRWARPQLEEQMNAGAENLLRQLNH